MNMIKVDAELIERIKESIKNVVKSKDYISCGCDDYCYHGEYGGDYAFDHIEISKLDDLIGELK